MAAAVVLVPGPIAGLAGALVSVPRVEGPGRR
jgi:hypothetical protein